MFTALIVGEAKQKILKIYNAGEPHDLALTLSPPEAQTEGDSQGNSSAEPNGWSVHVAYQASPDSVIFDKSFPGQEQATKIYDDIVKAVATVEGLIRSEKFEEAAAASKKLLEKLGANSAGVPMELDK